MDIVKERTRIIFTNYTDQEKLEIEELVATMDKVFHYEDKENRVIYLPTGMLEPIQKVFRSIRIVDKSHEYWPFDHIEQIQHTAEPRNQMQIDFIKFTLDNVRDKQKVAGILGPGSGKTFMACYSAIKIGMRTLIVTPTTGVKAQWVATLIKMFGVAPERISSVSSPKQFFKTKADFVVIVQSSLAIIATKYDLEKIMKLNRFGIKIIDEAHMFFHNIIRVDGSSNICHNWYLTATFGRSSEEEDKIYQQMFGDIKIFRVKDKQPTMFNMNPGDVYGQKPHMHVTMVWGDSRLTKEERKKVCGSMRYSERAQKWMRYGVSMPAYTNKVIPPDGSMTPFLQTVLRTCKIAWNHIDYGKMLVLSPTVTSVEILVSYIQKMFPDLKVGSIHSQKPKAESDKVKNEYDIICSTVKSCGTGFDVPGLSKLVVAEQFKSWINL